MATMRKITLDIGGCKGCQACLELAPENFAWDELTDKPRLTKDSLDAATAQECVAYCPEDCIAFADEEE